MSYFIYVTLNEGDRQYRHKIGSHSRLSIFISMVLEAFVTSVIKRPPFFPPVRF
jgi:hypothetical protein